jgi:hypothetical protein
VCGGGVGVTEGRRRRSSSGSSRSKRFKSEAAAVSIFIPVRYRGLLAREEGSLGRSLAA